MSCSTWSSAPPCERRRAEPEAASTCWSCASPYERRRTESEGVSTCWSCASPCERRRTEPEAASTCRSSTPCERRRADPTLPRRGLRLRLEPGELLLQALHHARRYLRGRQRLGVGDGILHRLRGA